MATSISSDRKSFTFASLSYGVAVLSLAIGHALPASGAPRGVCDPCDANCDGNITILDADAFAQSLLGAPSCSACASDVNGDESIDGRDIQSFIDCLLIAEAVGACCQSGGTCVETTLENCSGQWLGEFTSCASGICITGTLTAYRPQYGAGYFPFTRTPVAAGDRRDDLRGPGIRINASGDDDPNGEDDLIEVVAAFSPAGASVALRRTDPALRVWSTRNKAPGSEIEFGDDVTGALPVGPTDTTMTIWVEWASPEHGVADLHLESVGGAQADWIRFHTFQTIVLALGGEDQPPSVPVDPNHGTFVVGTAFYRSGYDVHMHDEDEVSASGEGQVYNKAVDAVSHRGVDRVAIFGYSHGGGSTHDLAERLDLNRAGIGEFEIGFTSYVDAVENDSDIDVQQELRRPPASGYHANHYQHGTLFEDFFLDGGSVSNSNPPPSGLDVETTPWGATSTHFQVDDFIQVREFIELNLVAELMP